MRTHALLVTAALLGAGCGTPRGAARDPGSATPVAGPAPAVDPTPRVPNDKSAGGGAPEESPVPVRPEEAPRVTVREVLRSSGLLGERVRVSGRCAGFVLGAAGGSWLLEDVGDVVEVRGLVPLSCSMHADTTAVLTIFAQVEPKDPAGRERLLLRLPD